MTPTLLRMVNINKRFGGIQALSDVDFTLHQTQVHALVGKNGAGKSTLMKVLMGVVHPDSGEIYLEGKKVVIPNTNTAQKLGISIVYQELSLVKDLSVAENIFLGRLPTKKNSAIVDWEKLYDMARIELNKLNMDIDPRIKVAGLKIAHQQIIEIAKALSFNSRILILDEPTSALAEKEVQDLFKIIKSLKSRHKVGIIYISHRLAEIEQIADYITVFRDGKKITDGNIGDFNKKDIIQNIMGKNLDESREVKSSASKEVLLSVQGLAKKNIFKDISFTLHKGEILGIAGLVGAKRTELVRTIFGVDPYTQGEIYVEGKRMEKISPIMMKKMGIALVPEDRKTQGLIKDFSVKNNLTVTVLDVVSKLHVLQKKKEVGLSRQSIRDNNIKTGGIYESINSMSGGNQQKVVLAKWLATKPKILLLDEPTRGIDVGAKAEIFNLLQELAAQGTGIIFISSELEEVVKIADRILIMYNGRLVGESTQDNMMTLNEIMYVAIGN